MREMWSWLKDEHNRGALQLLGGGLAAVVLAGWALFVFFYQSESPAALVPSEPAVSQEPQVVDYEPLVVEIVVKVREVKTRLTPKVEQYHTGQGGSYSNWLTVNSTDGWRIVKGSAAPVVDQRNATGGGTQFTRIDVEETESAVKVRAYAQPTSRHHGVTIVGHATFREERTIETRAALDKGEKSTTIAFPKNAASVEIITKYPDGSTHTFRASGNDKFVQVDLDKSAGKVTISER